MQYNWKFIEHSNKEVLHESAFLHVPSHNAM